MRIVHIAAEIAPLAKAGGLGDMVGGLAKELAKSGNDVEVILPRYGFLKPNEYSVEYSNFQSFENNQWHNDIAMTLDFEHFNLTLIEPNKEISYFNRPNIYGYIDDPWRFIYFSRAALEYLLKKKEEIDILHIHDWHTSLCAVLYKDHFQQLGLKIKKIVLNIHNVEYQGICRPADLDRIGMNGEKYLSQNSLKDTNFFFNDLNLLKGGIIYSDAIIAVSPTYGQEILTKEYGFGLEKVLNDQKHKLIGILNGIDTELWNPQNDPNIKNHYSREMPIEKIVRSKHKNKEHLREMLGLNNSSKPLISSIGRLVPQKGPELIEHCLYTTLRNHGQFLMLGSSMIKKTQSHFARLSQKHKLHEDASINFTYDESLAHQIYAASDFLIVPSLFEPCGLTQMLALRYGTIPIVRKTGGLSDTVFDVDDPSFAETSINGFTFEKFCKKSFDETLNRAFAYWNKDQNKIHRLIENGINTDHSLGRVSKDYMQLYRHLISS